MFQLLPNSENNFCLKARDIIGQEKRLISQESKANLGQFMTPAAIASFMASFFQVAKLKEIRLLDAGAGLGALSAAFLDKLLIEKVNAKAIDIFAYEIDNFLGERLWKNLAPYKNKIEMNLKVLSQDFIREAVEILQNNNFRFTHAILNPPYKKIKSDSRERILLRKINIETVNLYSSFLALTIALMEKNGQIVAIIPRSFCNGLYYKSFRKFILEKAAIKQIHLFNARDKIFKEDHVLQENIIIYLECGAKQGQVKISSSTSDDFIDYKEDFYDFSRIVAPNDKDYFFHIPNSLARSPIETSASIKYSLADIGLEVSTGPIVDFRVRQYIRNLPEHNTVPLIYPSHFTGPLVEWPKQGIKKPNALLRNEKIEKLLYPNGFYTVVRRFSSKEEKKRIVASMITPNIFNCSRLGFENHLNVFHYAKHGLPEELMRGLTIFLNSTPVNNYFGCFNGSTQVNVNDLRFMKYPSRDNLIKLGHWSKRNSNYTQMAIDQQVKELL